MPASDNASRPTGDVADSLRRTLIDLTAALELLSLERSHAMRRLNVAPAMLEGARLTSEALAGISDTLDALFEHVPPTLEWEPCAALFERAHDEVCGLWAMLLAGEREAA